MLIFSRKQNFYCLSLSVQSFLKLCESPKEPPFKNWPFGLDRVCKTNGKTKETEQKKEVLNVDPHCRMEIAGSQAGPNWFE